MMAIYSACHIPQDSFIPFHKFSDTRLGKLSQVQFSFPASTSELPPHGKKRLKPRILLTPGVSVRVLALDMIYQFRFFYFKKAEKLSTGKKEFIPIFFFVSVIFCNHQWNSLWKGIGLKYDTSYKLIIDCCIALYDQAQAKKDFECLLTCDLVEIIFLLFLAGL